MPHSLTHLPLGDLHASALNVRKHGPKAIDSLAASIRSIGLLQPLIVRKNTDGFEVVGGKRRLKALEKIAREVEPDADKLDDVPCIVIETDDDATAIEASLAENVERLPMDELDQYTAFAALLAKGRTEDEIADAFGITPAVVRRRLALARLIPDIHRLYRAGEIDGETLKLLTLATKERQKAYVALLRDPDAAPPPRWQLKAWLLGGAEIATSAALFDEAEYRGDIKGDLFGDERFFCDAEQFWKLQNAAIAELRDDLTANGWQAVHVVGPAERFQTWGHEPVPKAKGGAAFIEVEPNGRVTVHKGLLPSAEARKALRSAVDETGDESADEAARPERPELSAPLGNYIDLVRHSAVRLAVANAPRIALRLMLAHVIAGASRWRIEPERQQAVSEAIATALSALPSQTAFAAEREAARQLLGWNEPDGPMITHDASGARTADVLAKLIALSDKEVILVKPIAPEITTNLVITTDRRSYYLELHATAETYMASVSWTYPQAALTALKGQSDLRDRVEPPAGIGLDVEAMQFRYRIEGEAPWKPVRVFDDGAKVFIQFPSGLKQGEAPPLFVIGADGKPALVNYRVKGALYIVDRLFAAAELRLGTAPQQVVRIVRTDAVRKERRE